MLSLIYRQILGEYSNLLRKFTVLSITFNLLNCSHSRDLIVMLPFFAIHHTQKTKNILRKNLFGSQIYTILLRVNFAYGNISNDCLLSLFFVYLNRLFRLWLAFRLPLLPNAERGDDFAPACAKCLNRGDRDVYPTRSL